MSDDLSPPKTWDTWHGGDPRRPPRLHVVTGKGGTGKTTVAAALAVTLAADGQRVLLAEVEERQGISQVFDIPPLGAEEVEITSGIDGGEVFGLSVEAGAALVEYLRLFYKLGKAGDMLGRMGAIDFATTIAPGVRDVLLGGKIFEATRRTRSGQHLTTAPSTNPHVYDAVVLDAPPTGRVGRFLNVTENLADLAKVGPIRSQAESISGLLRSALTRIHVVTLLEQMPVQETADAIAELKESGLPVGAVIINQARATEEAAALTLLRDRVPTAEILTEHLSEVGIAAGPATVSGLVATGQAAIERWDLEHDLRREIDTLGQPVLSLDHLPEGIGPASVLDLAWQLHRQGLDR